MGVDLNAIDEEVDGDRTTANKKSLLLDLIREQVEDEENDHPLHSAAIKIATKLKTKLTPALLMLICAHAVALSKWAVPSKGLLFTKKVVTWGEAPKHPNWKNEIENVAAFVRSREFKHSLSGDLGKGLDKMRKKTKKKAAASSAASSA